MSTRSEDVEKAIRALRRRHPLLYAWLKAMDRLDGPRNPNVTAGNASPRRRPLLPSIERHPIGRRRLPYLVAAAPRPARS
jgi:hypothetical protein